MKLLIFTDLDGTLLDHHTYSAEPAASMIKQMHQRRGASVQVMPITSKTQAELAHIAQSVDFASSIKISENGSVIQMPQGQTLSGYSSQQQIILGQIILGQSYGDICATINKLPPALRQHITGFNDMTVAEVMDHTGLPEADATRAKQRDATEPFLWSGDDAALRQLTAHMTAAELEIQRGGRFYHCTGRATKVQAMGVVAQALQGQYKDEKLVTVALGDGPNDLAMIEAADYGVIIPNADGPSIHSDKPSVRLAPHPGPRGWVAAVNRILSDLELK